MEPTPPPPPPPQPSLQDVLNLLARPLTIQQQPQQQQQGWAPSLDVNQFYPAARSLPIRFDASFPPQQQQQQFQMSNPTKFHTPTTPQLQSHAPPPQQQPQFPVPSHQQQQQQQLQAPTPPAAQPPKRPDPRTVTTLAAANRYITRHLAPNPTFLSAVRSLRNWQRSKEQHWALQRTALKERLSTRPETEAKLVSILGRNVGPPTASAEQELRRFEREVWMKAKSLVVECEKELARLGVPLFCEGIEYNVEKDVLREWRLRVVELLEDLCEEGGE